MRRTPIISCLAGLILLSGCGDNAEQDSLARKTVEQPPAKVTSVTGVAVNQKVTIGDTLDLQIESIADGAIDSVVYTLAGQQLVTRGDIQLPTNTLLPGRNVVNIVVYLQGSEEKHTVPIELLSDIVPMDMTYQRVAYYTHDPDAFTQGLFYYNGYLYENTGKKGASSLRRVEVESGKILQQAFLPDQYFGEGITRWKDQIIQLTYTSNQGFVYNLDDFEQIRSFTFNTRTGEGWGLTTLEEELVMTDGSEYLYFLDPETLQETRQIPVYDHEGPVKNINELEYIEGVLYANVWQTDLIVTIDPNTGKVLSRIDLTGLMNASWNRKLDVLNGIAYDENRKRLFVTGKWWPRLYEIRLIEKKAS